MDISAIHAQVCLCDSVLVKSSVNVTWYGHVSILKQMRLQRKDITSVVRRHSVTIGDFRQGLAFNNVEKNVDEGPTVTSVEKLRHISVKEFPLEILIVSHAEIWTGVLQDTQQLPSVNKIDENVDVVIPRNKSVVAVNPYG